MVQDLSKSYSSLRAPRMLAPDYLGIANPPKVDTASSSKAALLKQAKVPYLPYRSYSVGNCKFNRSL